MDERHYYQVIYNGSEYDPYNGTTSYEPIKPRDLMTHFMDTHWAGTFYHQCQLERLHYEAGERQTVVIFSSEQVLDSETLKRICACGGWLPDTIQPLYMFVPQVARLSRN